MTREEFAKELKDFMSRYAVYVIAGHVKPDGDCIGAGVALGLALKALGKEVYIFYDGDTDRYLPVSGYVRALTPRDREALAKKPYACILIDLTDPARTGSGEKLFYEAADTLCIDHHAVGSGVARLNHIEPGMSAASEIVYNLFALMDIPVTKEMAEALYLGIAFDTGGFRHSSTTGDTYRMAGDLIDRGADATSCMNRLYHTRSFHEIRILSEVFRKARLYKGGIILAAMENKDFLKLGAKAEDAEGVVGYLNEVEEAEVAVYMHETEDGHIRVSLRSKGGVDVAEVAGSFHGGGHRQAAGCTLEGPMLLAKRSLLEALRERMA